MSHYLRNIEHLWPGKEGKGEATQSINDRLQPTLTVETMEESKEPPAHSTNATPMDENGTDENGTDGLAKSPLGTESLNSLGDSGTAIPNYSTENARSQPSLQSVEENPSPKTPGALMTSVAIESTHNNGDEERANLLIKRVTEAVKRDLDDEESLLPQDAYSLLVFNRPYPHEKWNVRWCSFMIGLSLFPFQVLTFTLLAIDVIDLDDKNPLGIPAGVDWQVLVSQVIALIITSITQDEVIESLNMFYNGYSPVAATFPGATRWKWHLSTTLRLIAGCLGLMVTLMLVITQDSVRELLLNFTAVEFVSNVDNTVLLLSKWGYLGRIMQEDAIEVQNATFKPAMEESTHFLSRHTGDVAENKKRRKFPRVACLLLIFVVLLSIWIYVVDGQRKGKFLSCQTIHVQFGDEFSPTLGTFSGVYSVDLKHKRRNERLGRRVEYVAASEGNEARFSYCKPERKWYFLYAEESRDIPSPCVEGQIRAESSDTFSFDVVDAASDTWFFHHDVRGRGVALQHFSMGCLEYYINKPCSKQGDCGDRFTCIDGKCLCEESYFGVNCQFKAPCKKLEITDRFATFSDTRPWSSNFTYLTEGLTSGSDRPIQVYGRPVYIGNDKQKDGDVYQVDLMFYTGRRWVLTHTGSFEEFEDISDPLQADDQIRSFFLDQEFHAGWTNYEVAFMSQAVDVDSPLDEPTPVGLEWYRAEALVSFATDSRAGSQSPDLGRQNSARLLCALCDSKDNRCQFDGRCSNGTCICERKTKGTLCQIPPVGDGFCDADFNVIEFNYDGGDCCRNTCTSTEEFSCGITNVDAFGQPSPPQYVGYPGCRDPSQLCDGDQCWRPLTDISGSNEGARAGGALALSADGAVVAIYEPGAGLVRIYEQDGPSWVEREGPPSQARRSGIALDTIKDSAVLTLSHDGGVLAVGWPPVETNPKGLVEVFEWQVAGKEWERISNFQGGPWCVALSGNGTVLATVDTSDPNTAKAVIYSRGARSWDRIGDEVEIETHERSVSTGLAASLSFDGMVFAAGSMVSFNSTLIVHRYDQATNTWTLFGPTISKARRALQATGALPMPKAAQTGNYVVSLGEDGTVAVVFDSIFSAIFAYEYDSISRRWKQRGEGIGGESFPFNSNPSISVSRDGNILAVGNRDQNQVRIFGYNQTANYWADLGPPLGGCEDNENCGTSVSLSADGTVVAFGVDGDSDFSPGVARIVWDPTPPDLVPITFVIQLDESPHETGIRLECDGVEIERVSSSSLSELSANSRVVGQTLVRKGAKCRFTITDTEGDGICCSESVDGMFKIYYGTNSTLGDALLAQGGQMFGSRQVVTFVVEPVQPDKYVDIAMAVSLERYDIVDDSNDVGLKLSCEDILEMEAEHGVFKRDPNRTGIFRLPRGTMCTFTANNALSTVNATGGETTLKEYNWILYNISVEDDSRSVRVINRRQMNAQQVVNFTGSTECDGCDCVLSVESFPGKCNEDETIGTVEVHANDSLGTLRLASQDGIWHSESIIVDGCGKFILHVCSPLEGCENEKLLVNHTCTEYDSLGCIGGNSNYVLSYDGTAIAENEPLCCETPLPVYDGCPSAAPSLSPGVSASPSLTPTGSAAPTSTPTVVVLECSAGSSPLRFELTMDMFPQDTSFQIQDASGNLLLGNETFSSDTFVNRTVVRQTCVSNLVEDTCLVLEVNDLTGDGLCCDHGVGNFTLYIDGNKADLPGGGTFSTGYRYVAVLGGCPPQTPAPAPVPTSLPTSIPNSCDEGEVLVRVEVTTDRHAEETRWHVDEVINTTSTEFLVGGPYTAYEDAHQTFSSSACVKNTTCLSFVVLDVGEDGMCCKSGRGGYKVWYGNSVAASGESWEGFSHEVRFGSCAPGATETFVPLQCEMETSALRVEVNTDLYPEEITWTVVDSNDETVLEGEPYDAEFTQHVNETCVQDNACFSFQIKDTGGDGISCTDGRECYKVFLGSELQTSGARFGAEESHYFCAVKSQSPSMSLSPSATPSHVTTSPSFSPHPTIVGTDSPALRPPPPLSFPSQYPSSSSNPIQPQFAEDPLSEEPTTKPLTEEESFQTEGEDVNETEP